MVERFEVGKTYRDSVGYVVDCLWAGDTVDEDGQLVAVRCSDGSQDAGRYITARWTEVKPLPPFPSGWAVLWRSGDSLFLPGAGHPRREDAEAYSRRFAHLAVALLEYHPDTRTITVHELDNQ